MKYKAEYTIEEIADLMGVSRQRCVRKLTRAGIYEGEGRGRKIVIPVTILETKMKDLWESIRKVARVSS